MTEEMTLLKFWAKKSKGEPEVRYPLLYHMLDVAMVTRALWDNSLKNSTRHFVAEQLGLSEPDAALWISFWAGLHDIGKATPAFQTKSSSAKNELTGLGFGFDGYSSAIPHYIATACILKNLTDDIAPGRLRKRIGVTIGGHHGVFPRSDELTNADLLGNKLWREAWHGLSTELSGLCNAKNLPSIKNAQEHAFFMLLAGLTSVADWIASNETYFPYCVNYSTMEEHAEWSKQRANMAITKLGWTGWNPPAILPEFGDLFKFQPRPLQIEIVEIAKFLSNSPGLVIIESPMGEGKTEAAMYLADSWITAMGQKGCYFALPTQATSNQMFSRVKSFLQTRYPDEIVNLSLLHGHSALSAEFAVLKQNFEHLFEPRNIGIDSEISYDKASASVVASEWFTYRKRGLLSPFGVGTIDQALLAVLQTKHVFVRLFGLAGKTVIIDEVHAYDAYMTTLLERLLEWLAALGSSVILLSATLPNERRNKLLLAYRRGLKAEDYSLPKCEYYPRISWATATGFDARHIATSPQSSKTLHLEWVDGGLPEQDKEFELGSLLQKALSGGGCAAVICNTVDRAQKVYLALKKYFPDIADDGYPVLDLFHARYLFGERDRREKRALLRFGKPESQVDCDEEGIRKVRRPDRAVLVATQVIEQSLDLDFDLMVTEMAPVDLILQRAGRLQRHPRKRPLYFDKKPVTIQILKPGAKEDGTPDFGKGTEAVYDPHILLRSWLILRDRNSIMIPEEVEELIEAVYGEDDWSNKLNELLRNDWIQSFNKLEEKKDNYRSKAATYRILPPNYEDDILEDFNRELDEDNPQLHESLQALTRLTEPTVQAICLYGDQSKAFLDAEYQQPPDLKILPDMSIVKALLKRSITISHKGLVHQLIGEGELVPEVWRKIPLLRHHYMLFFNEHDECYLGKYELCLDKELGLTIQKEDI